MDQSQLAENLTCLENSNFLLLKHKNWDFLGIEGKATILLEIPLQHYASSLANQV